MSAHWLEQTGLEERQAVGKWELTLEAQNTGMAMLQVKESELWGWTEGSARV